MDITKSLSVDVETTITEKGNPFNPQNKLVTVGVYNEEIQKVFDLYRNPEQVSELQEVLDSYKTLVGFNFKFDYHWLRRVGIDVSFNRIWDCSVVEKKLTHHTSLPYQSLDELLLLKGLPPKYDRIKAQWEKGIDTTEINPTELAYYNLEDCRLTWLLYQMQLKEMPKDKERIISIVNQDLHTLVEMESHGLKYDVDRSKTLSDNNNKNIEETKSKLDLIHNIPNFNWNSGPHISALLFGGIIPDIIREPIGVYKTGPRAGEVKFKKKLIEYRLPRRYKPLRDTELVKEGYYSTKDDVLSKLPAGSVIDGIRLIRKLSKDCSSFLDKNPNYVRETGLIHTNFNQTVTGTGRLSSSSPNVQNQSEQALSCFVTRFS